MKMKSVGKIEVAKIEVPEEKKIAQGYGMLVRVSGRWVRFMVNKRILSLELEDDVGISDFICLLGENVVFGVNKGDRVVGIRKA